MFFIEIGFDGVLIKMVCKVWMGYFMINVWIIISFKNDLCVNLVFFFGCLLKLLVVVIVVMDMLFINNMLLMINGVLIVME